MGYCASMFQFCKIGKLEGDTHECDEANLSRSLEILNDTFLGAIS